MLQINLRDTRKLTDLEDELTVAEGKGREGVGVDVHSAVFKTGNQQRPMAREAKVTRSCPTLGMDCTVRRTLRVRTLEWGAISFSRGSSQPRGGTQGSCMAGGFFTS